MTNKILFLICLISQSLLAQKINCSGKLLDKNSQNPIFGVALTLDNNVVCYSDEVGNFAFESDNTNKSITFSHISYVPVSLVVSVFEKGAQTIALTENTFELKEVVVAPIKKIPQKDILKTAMKQFKNNYRTAPYWSEMNYKQAILYNGVPNGYLECDGHIFMQGKNKSPWIYPMIIPNQLRRINEDPKLVELDYYQGKGEPNPYNYIGTIYMSSHWLYYRHFEVMHPLSSEGNGYFDFKIEETSYRNDSDYFVVHFSQKKNMHFGGWTTRYMSGKLWINKGDFNLQKINTSFGFDKFTFNQYIVDYTLIENKLYPGKIEFNNYNYRNAKNEVSNLVKNGIVTFTKIDFVARKNYAIEYCCNLYSYDVEANYDQNYWKSHPLEGTKYKNYVMTILGNADWDAAFARGAKQFEYKKDFEISVKEYFEKYRIELEKIMKRDLNLK